MPYKDPNVVDLPEVVVSSGWNDEIDEVLVVVDATQFKEWHQVTFKLIIPQMLLINI